MNHNADHKKFYLIAQNRDDLVILGIVGQSQCLARTPHEVLAEPWLVAGLPAEDLAIIHAIAAGAKRLGQQDAKPFNPTNNPARDCISANTQVQ